MDAVGHGSLVPASPILQRCPSSHHALATSAPSFFATWPLSLESKSAFDVFTLGSMNMGKRLLFAVLKCLLGTQLGAIQRHTDVSVAEDQAYFLERSALGLGADNPSERDECEEAAEVDKDDSGGSCQCLRG